MNTHTAQLPEGVLEIRQMLAGYEVLFLKDGSRILRHQDGGVWSDQTRLISHLTSRIDELNSQIIRLKSDIAHAIGFCRGVGHPEKYLEKYYPTLIPDQKEKREHFTQ